MGCSEKSNRTKAGNCSRSEYHCKIFESPLRRNINRQRLRGASVEANGSSPPGPAAVYHGICSIPHPRQSLSNCHGTRRPTVLVSETCSASILSKPIAALFNRALSTSTVPRQWKQACIRPIRKVSVGCQSNTRTSDPFPSLRF